MSGSSLLEIFSGARADKAPFEPCDPEGLPLPSPEPEPLEK